MVGRHRFYIPFGESFDVEAEKVKIQKDLQYQEGFLNIVRKKLSNERFISGAPEKVIEIEKNKEQDAVAKIAILNEKLTDLG
jgi:valyl-tRNA synthetase